MFEDLNISIEKIKEKQWKKRKYEEHIQRTRSYLLEEQKKVQTLASQLKKEQKDVKQLESASLTNVFYTIVGKKLEKLDKEQHEALAAELKYEEALETVKEVEAELVELVTQLRKVSDADTQYELLLREKEKLIHDARSIWSEELYELADQQAEINASLKEYSEAIEAGNKSSAALSKAVSSLESAKGWSTWDMVGGGMISTAIKHGHLDDSKEHIHSAQTKLRWFQEELSDVVNHDKIELDVGGMLTFADYFFDGIIVDWMVHGKINDSLQQVEQSKSKVDHLISQLKQKQSRREQDIESIKERRTNLLETIN